jgi:hypothetical protein
MLTRAVARPAWPTRVVRRRIEQSPPDAVNYGEDEKSHPLNFDSPKPRRQPLPRSSPCDHRPVHWSVPFQRGRLWRQAIVASTAKCRGLKLTIASRGLQAAPQRVASRSSPHTQKGAVHDPHDATGGALPGPRAWGAGPSASVRSNPINKTSARQSPRVLRAIDAASATLQGFPTRTPRGEGGWLKAPSRSVWAWPDRKGRHGCRGELLPAASKGACQARRDANCSRSMI